MVTYAEDGNEIHTNLQLLAGDLNYLALFGFIWFGYPHNRKENKRN